MIVGIGVIIGYENAYASTVYPGVRIGDVDFSGKTSEEVVTALQDYQDNLSKDGVTFEHEEELFVLKPVVYGANSDVPSYDMFALDVNETASRVFAIGRTGNWWQQGKDQLAALVGRRTPSAIVNVHAADITSLVHERFSPYETPSVNADFFVESDQHLRVEPHRDGTVFVDEHVVSVMHRTLAKLETPTIPLSLETQEARIRSEDVQALLSDAEDLVARTPMTLTFSEKRWEADRGTVARWLTVSGQAGDVTIQLNPERVAAFLDTFRADVEQEPKNGKFEMRDGKLTEFQSAKIGREIEEERTRAMILSTLKNSSESSRSVELAYLETLPEVREDNIEDLGIKEILGTGYTNFAGSDGNRTYNIKLGASFLHGNLIPPGGEFSTLAAVGDFGPEDGWKEGYVIKGDRTIPEYGGGACQFGTTLFRAAMAAGFKITNRRNHSYIVSYYYDEQGKPGKDATIYSPTQDFTFVNDTDHYVLIQSRIEGTAFYIDMWGTKDGRVASISPSRVWDWVPPPPKQIIETDELKPGETKCVEKPRSGAKTAFDYTVTDAEGEAVARTFSSTYKAWPEVCMVGRQPTPPSSPATQTQ